MQTIRYLSGAALVVFAMATLAQAAPFQVIGLNPDMVFTDARAAVEKMGAVCRVGHARTASGISGVSAECTLPQGSAAVDGGIAGKPGPTPSVPAIGAQPVTHVIVEAPLESAQLGRIMIAVGGSLDAVVKALEQQYGPPDHDSFAAQDPSWSHSKRKGWINGNYTLGLINTPQLVILTANRPAAEPASN